MIKLFQKELSDKKIKELEDLIKSSSNNNQDDIAWKNIKHLLKAQKTQEAAAISLTRIVEDQYLPIERGLEVLSCVFEAHKNNIEIISLVGSALEGARDIDQLNIEPPKHKLFKVVVEALSDALKKDDSKNEEMILNGLSTAARMMARQYDSVAEKSYRRLIEIDPEYPSYHYCLGLFCKTRGLFREGMIANQKASSLIDETIDSYQWNLGICATGAGEAEIALDVWKRMGNKIEMGRFNLPEGRYPQCKVKLSEYPLAERDSSSDTPGLEETIWIDRLSPCHGIIRSVLSQDLGVDYGDVVLIDGAPITYHTYGDEQIPVFPHLSTLVRNNYMFFDFAATQEREGEISEISSSLDKDAVVYVHTENFRTLCATCWRDPNKNHEEHTKEQKHIVIGRIAAPNDMPPLELLSQIDEALSQLKHCKIFAPDLCAQAGLKEREEVERRRFELLATN